ncbi:hypothetical protein [Maricaulis sp.]|uniref:hypothetical protein n=1 Tax=Maricaulis sp. TaxID=1486257 RepID=UPI0025BEE040|nr:hypothetical protein [Maricaulis sp.]
MGVKPLVIKLITGGWAAAAIRVAAIMGELMTLRRGCIGLPGSIAAIPVIASIA